MTVTQIWLLIGLGLCIVELVVPTAFVLLMMGLAALAIALVSLVLPHTGLQLGLWMALSTAFIWMVRQFQSKQKPASIFKETVEASTLTAINPGDVGRVLYEGNSWQARSAIDTAIPANQKVYVVRREGTTLFVMPDL